MKLRDWMHISVLFLLIISAYLYAKPAPAAAPAGMFVHVLRAPRDSLTYVMVWTDPLVTKPDSQLPARFFKTGLAVQTSVGGTSRYIEHVVHWPQLSDTFRLAAPRDTVWASLGSDRNTLRIYPDTFPMAAESLRIRGYVWSLDRDTTQATAPTFETGFWWHKRKPGGLPPPPPDSVRVWPDTFQVVTHFVGPDYVAVSPGMPVQMCFAAAVRQGAWVDTQLPPIVPTLPPGPRVRQDSIPVCIDWFVSVRAGLVD